MSFLRLFRFPPLAACALAVAQTPTPPPVTDATAPKNSQKSQWVFSILPKSFQKNPLVDLTVITEMTELGKKQLPASPSAPVYYLAQSSGFHQLGHPPGGEHTLKTEEVEQVLARSLATSGFLPATREHPPALVIFYTWGSHNLLMEGDEENPSLSAEMVARNLLDRAALVGGVKFSEKMLKLFQEADDMATLNRVPPPDPSGSVPPIEPILGPAQMDFLNPVNRFKESDPKNDAMFEQFTNDVYYVVASAYDYASVSTKAKRLYWRTRMTVAAQGVSQDQTLPTLIVAAGPYFGKDMSEPELITKKATPEGTVEIGTATVVEMPATESKTSAPAKPR